MLLNRLEFLLMNNPVRAAFQRHVETLDLSKVGSTLHDSPTPAQ